MINRKMPARYWAQLNGKTAQENYKEQKAIILRELEVKELEKQMEQEIFVSMMSAIDNGASALEQDVAQNVVNSIEATFSGGGIHPERLNSFSKQIAIGLGKALGDAPFKMLEDLLHEDNG